MTPFIDGRLLALGPWIVPAMVVLLIGLTILAAWLIESGLDRKPFWILRLMAGFPIAGYVLAVGLALAVA